RQFMHAQPASTGIRVMTMLAIPSLFFIAISPTLSWLEFSSGSENLVVASALETRRTGQWLLPTLQGEPRIAKPPLATWLASASIRPATLADLDSSDISLRQAAYRQLGWQVRWTALLCACATLAATYELGRMAGGLRIGVLAALVHGSSYAFLRYSR